MVVTYLIKMFLLRTLDLMGVAFYAVCFYFFHNSFMYT